MKAIIILNYASEEDIGKKTSIRLRNEENEWVEEVVIKPMPKKDDGKLTEYCGDWGCGYADGWNTCLDIIMGETEYNHKSTKQYEANHKNTDRRGIRE